MNFKKVNKERGEELLLEGINLSYTDNTLTQVTVNTPQGPITIKIESYYLVVLEEAKKERFYLQWQAKVASDIVMMEKTFESGSLRSEYILEYLQDIPEDELFLDTFLVSST